MGAGYRGTSCFVDLDRVAAGETRPRCTDSDLEQTTTHKSPPGRIETLKGLIRRRRFRIPSAVRGRVARDHTSSAAARTQAEAPFTSTPAHFSNRVRVAA